MRYIIMLVTLMLTAPQAYAHMVTYKNGTGIMQVSNARTSISDFNYTVHPRFAVVYRRFEWRTNTAVNSEIRNIGQINVLLKRWNNPNSQGNIYLGLGYGEKETMSYQIQTDWEDRKYYLSAEYQALDSRIDSTDMNMQKLRAGIAPYVANSGALHSWLILQYAKNDALTDSESLTPFIRMFYESVLVEFGYSFDGMFNFNFMVHF